MSAKLVTVKLTDCPGGQARIAGSYDLNFGGLLEAAGSRPNREADVFLDVQNAEGVIVGPAAIVAPSRARQGELMRAGKDPGLSGTWEHVKKRCELYNIEETP